MYGFKFTIYFANDNYRPQRSCGKVIFSQASVIHSVHKEVYPSMHWGRLSGQTPPPARQPLPSACWDTHPPCHPLSGHCCGRYASYWNTFLLPIMSILIQHSTCMYTLNFVVSVKIQDDRVCGGFPLYHYSFSVVLMLIYINMRSSISHSL